MIIKVCHMEGREERCTETVLPEDKNWEELQEYILLAVKKGYKYSDEKIPEGLDVLG